MSIDVFKCFSRKTFFVTGGTGFMGKVFLFKIMKEFPDFDVIYVLIRGKKVRKFNGYLSPQERIEKEVLTSFCFDPLREAMGADAFKALSSRIIALEGNITDDRLGLSENNRQMLLKSVNFIVHMAATVNFDERLDIAVGTNTLGSLRVLALAKECQKLEGMVHVSTCYVNYNLKEKNVEERLYPLPFDPELMCKTILALHVNELDKFTTQVLKKYDYPNSYTFTKSMGEHLISLYRDKCPVAIVRPSIVGCSCKEPFPGWVDALTAAGGLLLTTGLGVVREVLCRPDAVADVVPVDFVVNTIIKALFKTHECFKKQQDEMRAMGQPQRTIVGDGTAILAERSPSLAAATAQERQQQQVSVPVKPPFAECSACHESRVACPLVVYQAATSSSMNHLTWGRLHDSLRNYWESNKRHPKAIGPMTAQLITSKTLYSLLFTLRNELPYHVLCLVAKLPPPFGSEENKKLVKKLGRVTFRAKDLNRQFHPFTLHEWNFMVTNTKSLDEGLDERSCSTFYFDTYAINWWFYSHAYVHGLLKYILRDTAGFKPPEEPRTATEIFKRASLL